MEKQLSVLMTGMFERPLLLNLYNLKDVKCVRRYVGEATSQSWIVHLQDLQDLLLFKEVLPMIF